MRIVIHLLRILRELDSVLHIQHGNPTFHAEVFEDNSSAFMLANNQQLSPRSRHLNVKWHWFWEHIKSEQVTVSKIARPYS